MTARSVSSSPPASALAWSSLAWKSLLSLKPTGQAVLWAGAESLLPLRAKQELYRVAQEALHNTVKHAHARHVDLRLDQSPNGVTLEVRDDGTGFDTTASFPGHLGLHSMRERVTNLGGTFQIESTLGVGTRMCVRIPGRF